MNDLPDESRDEEVRLGELLAPLRSAEPTPDMQRANRRAARSAGERVSVLPWWQRSIAVPVPVAVATAAALLLALGWQAVGRMSTDGVTTRSTTSTRSVEPTAAPRTPPDAGRELAADAEFLPRYTRSETHRYLPGVGVTHRHVIYLPEESR